MVGAVLVIVGIIMIILWIWSLIDIIKAANSEFTVIEGENAKLIWIIIVILLPIIGTIIYAILEKRLFLRSGFKVEDEVERLTE